MCMEIKFINRRKTRKENEMGLRGKSSKIVGGLSNGNLLEESLHPHDFVQSYIYVCMYRVYIYRERIFSVSISSSRNRECSKFVFIYIYIYIDCLTRHWVSLHSAGNYEISGNNSSPFDVGGLGYRWRSWLSLREREKPKERIHDRVEWAWTPI